MTIIAGAHEGPGLFINGGTDGLYGCLHRLIRPWIILYRFLLFLSSFHYPVKASFILFLFDRLTFIVHFLSARQPYFQFCQSFFIDKKFCGNNGKSRLFRSFHKLSQFTLGKQQFTVAPHIMALGTSSKKSELVT